MIRNFRSKALRKLFDEGEARGLPANQISRIENRLATLDASKFAEDMNVAGFGFHKLSGDLKGFYAVKVTGNRRIIFRIADGDALDVDFVDYH